MGPTNHPSTGGFYFQCGRGNTQAGTVPRSLHLADAYGRRGTYRLLAGRAGIDLSRSTFPGDLLVQRTGLLGPVAVARSLLAGGHSGAGSLYRSVQL